MNQIPTKGRIVLFKHDEITAREAGGNTTAGHSSPAMIVQAWPDIRGSVVANLKVFTDGPSDVWVTSVYPWDAEGVVSLDVLQPQRTYRWPSRS